MNKKQNNKKATFWGVFAAILALAFIATPLLTLTYISDSDALVVQTARVDAASAANAKRVAKQLYKNLQNPTSVQRYQLTLSEDEINGIIALVMRGINGLKGRVNITPIGAKGAFSFKLPSNPFGQYINLTATIDPSSKGLVVNDVFIGRIEIPGDLAISLVEALLNKLISGEALGTKLISSIESIRINNSKLIFVYRAIPDLKKIINKGRKEAKDLRDDLALLGDPGVTKLYYQALCKFHKQIDGFGDISLGYYLTTAFSFAEKRTLISEAPSEENRAALLALAIFLGSTDFDSVIGAIDKETLQKCQPTGSHIVLANRNDLRLHFIYSAALKIISDSGVSFAIGEFKELLDSGQGGSGFSFADLAADRAGIRFAEKALDNTSAFQVQRMASQLTQEKVFFPSISGLPERISQPTFKQRGGIESPYYKKLLATINHRIDNLPLYQK